MASLELQPRPSHSSSDNDEDDHEPEEEEPEERAADLDLERGQSNDAAPEVVDTTGEALSEKEIRRTLLGDDEDPHSRHERLRAADADLSAGIDASLDRSTSVLADTESFSAEAMALLQTQRESFHHQRLNLAAVEGSAIRSENILRAMRRRLTQDRHMQILIILAELLAIFTIVYVKYYK